MKKAVLSLALALLTGASLLAGCAPQATEPDSGAKQDEVVISISSEPDSLDPCQGWGHGTTPLVQQEIWPEVRPLSPHRESGADFFLFFRNGTWGHMESSTI